MRLQLQSLHIFINQVILLTYSVIMAQQQLNDLREKFEAQERQFQNYRQQCKKIENFLEEETQKKEQQIRKLKQESITKEKNFKLLKSQNAQLLTEISNLKSQINKMTKLNQSSSNSSEDKIKRMESENDNNQGLIKNLQYKIDSLSKQLEKERLDLKTIKQDIILKNQAIQKLEGQISKLKDTVQLKQQRNIQLSQINQSLMEKNHNQITKTYNTNTVKKTQSKEDRGTKQQQLQKKLKDSEQKIKRYLQKNINMQKTIKQLKLKSKQTQQNFNSSSKKKTENLSINYKFYIGCVIITKPHYMSPFLDINDETKTVKLYKSARNGCFQKSLGATKHKFSSLTYRQVVVVEEVADKIKNNQQNESHLVLIYGTKKSSKKNIFSEIIAQLYDYFVQKISKCIDNDYSAIYIRKTQDQQKQFIRQQAFSYEQIISLLDSMTKICSSELKKSDKILGTKKLQRPRICYFNIKINQFSFQIATSSFTNISMKQKDDASTFYNNVLYSKLPDILQPSFGQKYLILTLNPIVDLYDQCKNILNVTQYKSLYLMARQNDFHQNQNPNKQMLNAYAKKRLELYQKEIVQNSIKIKRIEDECFFYKLKFCQLQQRLKNLISTHHSQNSYLKKSPILLSYEKMLKFIHSVQAKSSVACQSKGGSTIELDQIEFQDKGYLSDEAL